MDDLTGVILALEHTSGTTRRLALPAPSPEEMTQGWRTFRSDTGRLWATRETPFSITAELAGASRTIDADDWIQLCACVAAQEANAEIAPFL